MKERLVRIILTGLLLIGAVITEHILHLPEWQLLLVYLLPYLLIGYDVFAEAAEGLIHGNVFNENFLMCIATVGALLIGFLPDAETQFPEAVFVMLFFQVGELFEEYAEGHSRKSVSNLMDIRPDTACVERDNTEVTVHPSEIHIGETIIIRPGEKIPLDSIVTEGSSALNTVALTGESSPREVSQGDEILSGCINISGLLKARVCKTFGLSTASQIIELMEHATKNKSHSETFITRFARIYTPIVVMSAILVALLPPLLFGQGGSSFSVWLYRALCFLVVACPCALVLSVPLTFFGGIGGASKNGILIKGGNYIDALAKTGVVVFDKTGTLTEGQFKVNAVHPDHCNENHLLHLAAHVERYSTHPIAISLRNAYPNEKDHCLVEDIEEIAGQGIKALINGQRVCVGNSQMMETVGVQWHTCHKTGTVVHVAINGQYAGHIIVSDKIKEDAKSTVNQLKALGVGQTVMLTGDKEEVAAEVAMHLGIDEYHAQLLPADKVTQVQRLLAQKPSGKTLIFAGDGINDAPVLALADIGIAMGALGSDAAIEAADVVLMEDKPSQIVKAIKLAKRTLGIARQNIVFAITVKIIVLLLAALGWVNMWLAVFADVGVTVIVVLNAMRALQKNVNSDK